MNIVMCASAQQLIPQPQEIIKTSKQSFRIGKITTAIDTTMSMEQYKLTSNKGKINIIGGSEQAIIWAEKTLNQLTIDGKVGDYKINDYPAFDFRAFMYDSGRNFVEIDMIKQFIDLIS